MALDCIKGEPRMYRCICFPLKCPYEDPSVRLDGEIVLCASLRAIHTPDQCQDFQIMKRSSLLEQNVNLTFSNFN